MLILSEKNSIFAQPVSVRNWPVNKLTRETRDVDVANVAKSNIFLLSFTERKTSIYFLSEARCPKKWKIL